MEGPVADLLFARLSRDIAAGLGIRDTGRFLCVSARQFSARLRLVAVHPERKC